MIELAQQQKGEIVEPSNGGLKDVRISSESSPFKHMEVLSREDLQLTEQAAYDRGKKEAEANLQQQLDVLKAEYTTEKDKELADFCDNIRNELAEKNVIFVDHKKKTTWVKQERIKAE